MKSLAFISALFVVCGCASRTATIGRPLDDALVARIVDGQTTRTQILEWFGKPYSVQQPTPEQKQMGVALIYGYGHGQGTKHKQHVKVLAVLFDQNDVVVGHNVQQN